MLTNRTLTADRPTGPLHLGHYVGSLRNRVEMQKDYESFVMIADVQALSDNFENPEKVERNIFQVCRDYIAVGIDPLETTIFIQSLIPELSELFMYYINLVTLARLERNPTVKAEMKQKGFESTVPVGFLCYPISQAADITAFKPKYVPVGDDQLPMIEQSNEIVRKFNNTYNCDVLKESEPYLSKTQRLVGIDGKAKASKSLNNAVFLCDSSDTIRKKVYEMYTDPDHIKISDPGKIEGNVVFAYLDAFWDNEDELKNLKEQYKKGGVGDTSVKKILDDVLQELVEPFRKKREAVTDDQIIEILKKGSIKARQIAATTLSEVKQAIGISYFN